MVLACDEGSTTHLCEQEPMLARSVLHPNPDVPSMAAIGLQSTWIASQFVWERAENGSAVVKQNEDGDEALRIEAKRNILFYLI